MSVPVLGFVPYFGLCRTALTDSSVRWRVFFAQFAVMR